jgi:hypothetical protein
MDMHCVLFEAGTECVCVCKFAQRLSGLNVTVRWSQMASSEGHEYKPVAGNVRYFSHPRSDLKTRSETQFGATFSCNAIIIKSSFPYAWQQSCGTKFLEVNKLCR